MLDVLRNISHVTSCISLILLRTDGAIDPKDDHVQEYEVIVFSTP